MKKTMIKQIGICVSACLLTLVPAKSATVNWTTDVLADWSFTDSIQGYSAQIVSGQALYIGSGSDGDNGGIINGSTVRLTDATSSNAPTLAVLAADTDTVWQFDLTTLAIPAANRELTSFSMWMQRNDDRRGVNLTLRTSLDGVTWTDWNAVEYDSTVFEDGTYNQLTFTFASGEATNFNYISVVDKTFGGRNAIWTEWDANIVAVPEPHTALLLGIAACCAIVVCKVRQRRASSTVAG